MRYLFYILLFISCLSLTCCQSEVFPKPKGMLRLEYPQATYKEIFNDFWCPFSFEVNSISKIERKKNGCDINIHYPKMKATIYLTYNKVQGNIKQLLRDAQKFTFDHTIKADNIISTQFVNDSTGVYGMFYQVLGNAASQAQFYATDSVSHFISGSVYFKVIPNYDSIQPASHYLENDVRQILETLKWDSSTTKNTAK